MELSLVKGTTSKLVHVLIKDSSVTTGAGLTGLAFNTASLIAYYFRPGDTSATAIPLVTAALGTWTSGGFKEVDATHMPGIYEFGIPNACLASGANQVEIRFQGAANMQQTTILLELTGWNNQDATAGGISRLDAAVSSRMATYVQPTGFLSATFPTTVASTTNITSATGVDVRQINGVSIAGTGTQVGAAFLNFFNVATPTGNVNSLPSAIPGALGGLLWAGTNDSCTFTNDFTVGGNCLFTGNYTIGGAFNIGALNLVGTANFSNVIIAPGTGNGLTIIAGAGGGDIVLSGDGQITGNLNGNVLGTVASLLALAAGSITNSVFAADTGKKTVRSGTAQAGGNLTITYDAGASSVNDFYKSHLVYITGGTGAGQARFITGYTGSSKVAVVGTQWQTNPDNTSTFADLPFDNLTTSLTAAAIDAQLSGTHGVGAWGSTVTGGAFPITITVTDGTQPLQNVQYNVYDGGNALVGFGQTNASGNGTISANAGTYTVALAKGGYTFAATTRTVTGAQTGTLVNNLVMTVVSPITPPSDPTMQTLQGTLRSITGPAENVEVAISLVPTNANRPLTVNGNTITFTAAAPLTDNTGFFTINLPRTDLFDDQAQAFYHIVCQPAEIDLDGIALGTSPVDISTL